MIRGNEPDTQDMLGLMNYALRHANWHTMMATLLLAAVWVCPAVVRAQAPGWTLREALDAAWQRHPPTAAVAARQAEAQAGIAVADSLTPAPASVSLGQKSDRLNGNAGMREWEVELAAPLWLPGQKAARASEAQRAAHALDARTVQLRWQLAGEVREAWWAVAAARAGLALARQRLSTAEALAANVQRRFAVGDLARVDANLAQGERLAAQADLLEADKTLRQAEQAFTALTGRPAPDTLHAEAPATADTIDPTVHPRLHALRTHLELAESRIALVDASRRDAPELALSWTSERSEAARPYERVVGLKLTVPLSSRDLVQRGSAAARAEVAEAEAELAVARHRVEQDIASAQAELVATEGQLATARERHALTIDTLQWAQRSFDLGESDLPALMRARADAREAEAALQHQQVAHALALSRRQQALGLLP